MQFNEYSSEGRTLFVEFKCRRCGEIHLEPLENVHKRSSDTYGYLHNLKLPQGWATIGYSTIVCEKCQKAYTEFMQGGSGNG